MEASEPPSVPATILWWLWRSGHERQLTDCLGATAGVDPAVAYGLAGSVLDANQPRDHSIYLQGIDSPEIIDAEGEISLAA